MVNDLFSLVSFALLGSLTHTVHDVDPAVLCVLALSRYNILSFIEIAPSFVVANQHSINPIIFEGVSRHFSRESPKWVGTNVLRCDVHVLFCHRFAKSQVQEARHNHEVCQG